MGAAWGNDCEACPRQNTEAFHNMVNMLQNIFIIILEIKKHYYLELLIM